MPIVNEMNQRIASDLVKAGKPGKYSVKNSKGLKLKIFKSGNASWIYRFNDNEQTIGSFLNVSYQSAKGEAEKLELQKFHGKNPIEYLKEQKINLNKIELEARHTFNYAVERFSESSHWQNLSSQHKRDAIGSLQRNLLSEIGHLHIKDLKRSRLISYLSELKDERPSSYNRIKSYGSKFYKWMSNAKEFAHYFDDEFINPFFNLETAPEKKRTAYLTPKSSRRIWDALDRLDDITVGTDCAALASAIKLLLITGKRVSEVRKLKWSDIDFKNKTFEIINPKSGEGSETVALTDLSMEIITSLPKTCDYVFSRNGENLVTLDHKTKNRIADLAQVTAEKSQDGTWTFHDFRRSIRSCLAELNCEPWIAERILGHKFKGIEAHYNQSQQLEQKRKWLVKWEQEVFKNES